jgi:hypothetical protein
MDATSSGPDNQPHILSVGISTEGQNIHDSNYIAPNAFYIKRHIPWLLVGMTAMILITGLSTAYVYFHVASSAHEVTQQLSIINNPDVDPEQQMNARQRFKDLFTPATAAAYDNPFATPTPTAYKNPFGTYENPFTATEGQRQFVNPFASN